MANLVYHSKPNEAYPYKSIQLVDFKFKKFADIKANSLSPPESNTIEKH